MSEVDQVMDWTQGGEGIAYQYCTKCQSTWYVQRTFCPSCGNTSPRNLQASGRGLIYSTAVVTRAPTEALRAYAPYTIALVDCEEGFRVMAHAQSGVTIGDRVAVSFVEFGGKSIPKFRKTKSS